MRSASALAVFAGIAVSVMACLSYAFWSRSTPGPDLSWVRTLYQVKVPAADIMSSPKMVLVGGSSVHFGYDAKVVSELTGANVFNLGSHASLGPMFHLHFAEKITKPGDTIVLVIEYENFTTDWKITNLLKDYVRWFEPTFDLGFTGYFSTRLFSFWRERLITWVSVRRLGAMLTPFRPAPIPIVQPPLQTALAPPPPAAVPAPVALVSRDVYDTKLINPWGDQTGKNVDFVVPATRLALQWGGPFPLAPLRPALFRELHRFVLKEQARGVRVVATWPTILEEPAYASPAYQAFFATVRAALEAAGIPVKGQPQDVMVPFEDVLDTRYHLNDAGAERTSAILAETLRDK